MSQVGKMRSHPHKVLICEKTCVSIRESSRLLNGIQDKMVVLALRLSYIVPQSEMSAKGEGGFIKLCSSQKGPNKKRKSKGKFSGKLSLSQPVAQLYCV